jgi:hypothetical protein
MRDFTGLNGTKNGGGWENCSKPLSNYDIMIVDAERITKDINRIRKYLAHGGDIRPDSDQVRYCDECHLYGKFVVGRFLNIRITECRECGNRTYIPMKNGVEITSREVSNNG